MFHIEPSTTPIHTPPPPHAEQGPPKSAPDKPEWVLFCAGWCMAGGNVGLYDSSAPRIPSMELLTTRIQWDRNMLSWILLSPL